MKKREMKSSSIGLEHEAMLWNIQYTHARCCELRLLWDESQSSRCQSLGGESVGQAHRSPSSVAAPLPWLDAEHQLRGHNIQSMQLIQALMATADDMLWIPYQWPSQQYYLLLRRAIQLCQAFDSFYRACLSGFSQIPSGAEAAETLKFQAWFGLVVATEKILKALLESCFHAESPQTL
ncbi:MAG: hypothetical protein HC800_16895 [Phormidesmis sp. RL_2_1]|nr:hypothetical protein [Phormidesmis sp. RL_2_1]